MKRMLGVMLISLLGIGSFAQNSPLLDELEEVSQLPDTFPQRVQAVAFDGRRLWFAIYLDRGGYAKFDPETRQWDTRQDPAMKAAISHSMGQWGSPGGMVFIDQTLWLGSSYGEHLASFALYDPRRLRVIEGKYKPQLEGSQSYADLAYDGNHLWAAWHSFHHPSPRSKTQLLLKIDKDTGGVLAEFPLPPGESTDGTHGLTWDGRSLWHAKGNQLTQLDRKGLILQQFQIPKITRPSGLAWDGRALWIVEFGGKVWRLPFQL